MPFFDDPAREPGSWRPITRDEALAAAAAFTMAHPRCGRAVRIWPEEHSLVCWCEACEDLRTYAVDSEGMAETVAGAALPGVSARRLLGSRSADRSGWEVELKIEKSVVIAAPVEEVFGYVGSPANLPEVWKSLLEVTKVRRLAGGGHRVRWAYTMGGEVLEGESTDIEYVRDERIVALTEGQVQSFMAWRFLEEAGGTRVVYENEYRVPEALKDAVSVSELARENERQIKELLLNLLWWLGAS